MRKIFFLCILSLFEISKGQSGTVDPSFGSGGHVLTSSALSGDFFSPIPRQCFIQPNGDLLMVLQANNKTKITRRLANGNMDVSYGNNGYSVAVSLYPISAAQQSDGKVVVAGITGVPPTYFAIARYNTDGTLDASFGNKGTTITSIGSADNLNAIVITSQGKIIVGGTTVLNGQGQAVLVQYTTAGLPDMIFGNNGIMTDPVGPYSISSLAIQQDGKIVSAGSSSINDVDFALARYNVDGSRDLSFNGTGLVTSNFGPSDAAHSVLINSDGKIYVGGQTTDASGFWRFVIARYNSDGSPDLNFNAGLGFVSPAFGNSYEVLTNIRFQSNGKIIAAGTSLGSPSNDIELMRINTDGTIDNSFGANGNGLILADINSGSDESDFLVVQQDDKIVTGGYSADFADPTPAYLFSCFRFSPDGVPDADFGPGGSFTDFIPGSFYNHIALFQQADGKLLAASEANDNSLGVNKHFLNRFNEDGSIDNTFGQNGTQEINFVNGLAIFQTDGKLLRTASSNTGNGDIMMVRSNSDGTPDMSFGNAGTVISDLGGNEFPTSLSFQPDGKIIIGGLSRDNNGSDFLLVRYNPDGSVDASFGTGGYFKMDSENEDAVQSIGIAPDGKIVCEVAGTLFAPDFSSFDLDVLIVRLNPDGSIDTNFGDQGKVVINRTGYDYTGRVKVQNNGKIVFTHYASTDGSLIPVLLARLNADGTPDNNFGQNGEVVCDGATILLQDDQKIIILGYKVNGKNNTDFILSRFNADGSPDLSFGTNGKTIASFVELDNFLFQSVLLENTLFTAGSGVDQNGSTVGIIAKFKIDDIGSTSGITCPANQTVNTDNNLCTAIVSNIDPVVTPNDATVNYTLSGATTGLGTGSMSGKSFNKGITTVTYSLSSDVTKTCSFTVTVQDKQLPVINNLNVSQTTLWPPDHKLKDITVNYSAGDNCGIANTQVSVSSDEPVQTREKDDQSPDWQILDNNHVRLRAERSQIGNGRTYTIKVTTTDVNGNQNSATATVNVPRSPGHTDCKFIMTAAPNPSRNYFLVKINSSCWDKINLRLLNNRGSVLKIITNINPLAVLKIGDNLIPGVYYLEATQSGVTKTIKLIKQ